MRGSGTVAAAVLGLVALAAGTGCDAKTAEAPQSSVAPTPTGPAPTTPASTSAASRSAVPAVSLPPAPADGFGGPVTVTFGSAPPLRVEIAARPDQRARGLMQRAQIPAGTGMLFLFPAPSSGGGFWMLGTLAPISIAYVNGDRVVSIAEMQPCPPREPLCPTYPAAGSYTAAVEAHGGFFTEHGIGAGARMTVSGPTPAPR